MSNQITIYDGKKIAFSFEEVQGEAYLILGDNTARYHLQMPDYNSKSNIARVSLPAQLVTAVTAKAVFERAFVDQHINRDGSKSLKCQFPQISTQVALDKPLPGTIRKTAGVWATRKEHAFTA